MPNAWKVKNKPQNNLDLQKTVSKSHLKQSFLRIKYFQYGNFTARHIDINSLAIKKGYS